MRFNTNAIGSAVAMSMFAVQVRAGGSGSSPTCEPCPEAVVLQAAQEGFLEYVMENCMHLASSTKNVLGEVALDGSLCVSEWIAAHQTGSPIPTVGDCRDTYQALVDAAIGNWHSIDCTFDATEGFDITDDCVQDELDHKFGSNPYYTPLSDFRRDAGFYLGGVQCKSVTVRTLSNKGAYSRLIAGVFTTPNAIDNTEDLIVPDIDGGDGLCYSCYHNFATTLIASASDSVARGTNAACLVEANSVGCIESTEVMDALEEFKLCSGGFPMMFEGPVCTQADIDEVQQLIPAPYYTFAHCAFNAADPICATIPAYIAQIKADSDSSCMVCYQDFYNKVTEDAELTENIAACTGTDGVYHKDCIAAESMALFNFKACSGFDLSHTKAAAVVPIATTTTTAAPETTAAPTTTKAAAMASSAGITLIAALVMAAAL